MEKEFEMEMRELDELDMERREQDKRDWLEYIDEQYEEDGYEEEMKFNELLLSLGF